MNSLKRTWQGVTWVASSPQTGGVIPPESGSLHYALYIYIYIYIYIHIHVYIHTYTHTYITSLHFTSLHFTSLHFISTLVGADDGPRRERGRGRRESAAGAGPGTTQGKLNRQTARLTWPLWHNHASKQSTTQGHSGQWGHATSRSQAGDHARLPNINMTTKEARNAPKGRISKDLAHNAVVGLSRGSTVDTVFTRASQ